MEQFLNRPFTLDRAVRIGLFVLMVVTLSLVFSAIWEVLLPFMLAGIFAYMMMPFVRFCQYKLRIKSRGLSVLLVFLIISAVVTLAVMYLVPAIQGEIEKTLQSLSTYRDGKGLLDAIVPDSLRRYINKSFDPNRLIRDLNPKTIIQAGEQVWSQISGIVSGTLSIFSWGLVFAMGIVYFIFIMIDFEGLGQGFIGLFPRSYRRTVRDIFVEVDYYMNSYFRGQVLIALTVGVLLTIGFNIIGLPMATAMGIFIGLLNFIPYMQALGVLPLGLAALLMSAQTDRNIFVCFLLAYGVLMIVQILQDTFIVPRIMGSSMGMRPSLILLALAVWGYLLGFFGMLIALPLTMSLYSIYMRYVLRDKAYMQLIDEKVGRRKPKPRDPKA